MINSDVNPAYGATFRAIEPVFQALAVENMLLVAWQGAAQVTFLELYTADDAAKVCLILNFF